MQSVVITNLNAKRECQLEINFEAGAEENKTEAMQYMEKDCMASVFLFHQINMRLTVSCVKISSASYSISVQSTDSF